MLTSRLASQLGHRLEPLTNLRIREVVLWSMTHTAKKCAADDAASGLHVANLVHANELRSCGPA